jgi:hypothetical protein
MFFRVAAIELAPAARRVLVQIASHRYALDRLNRTPAATRSPFR